MKKILFVCTGNTCRSPMAAALMNKMLGERGVTDVTAESAGLAAAAGAGASQNAILAAREHGADLTAHRARQLTGAMVDEADAVYALAPSHRQMLLSFFKGAAGKIRLLGAGIEDPFGGGLETYRRCRDEIEAALDGIIGAWAK